MALGLSEPSSLRGSTSVPVWLNIKAMTGCALIEQIIILRFQFSVDNYLLQALGWGLAEYGDSLQSLVATRLEKQIHSMHIFRERHRLLGSIHYITLVRQSYCRTC